LTEDDVRGESFYNDDLPKVVAELKERGLAVEDQGAQVVFLHELADKNGKPSPAIVQKKDGGYLYSTSDLAAIRFRVNELKADRIIVFSDARQSLHMKQVYTIAKKAGFSSEHTLLEHCPFGTMMGKDGKPFKSRSGDTVKLATLLQESIDRASSIIRDNPEIDADEKAQIARNVGIGAIKYADLSKTRTLDYVFDWEQMLSFQSIFRSADISPETISKGLRIESEQESALVIKLFQFDEIITQVATESMPHLLCNYLYELASLFMTFYEACPILKDGTPEATKLSRLVLSKHVARTLKAGLDLLGIDAMDRM